jgi:hypothetical protein
MIYEQHVAFTSGMRALSYASWRTCLAVVADSSERLHLLDNA